MRRGRRSPWVGGILGLLVLGGVLAGCSGSDGPASGPAVAVDEGPAVTFVAIGGSETNGGRTRPPLADSWAQIVFREHLPRRTVFVNLARERSTVAEALVDQVARAEELDPTIVTVWLGTADAFVGTDPDAFAGDLGTALTRLQATGAEVLVVLGPPPYLVDEDDEPTTVDTTAFTDRAEAVAVSLDVEVVDVRDLDLGRGGQDLVADAVAEEIGPVD